MLSDFTADGDPTIKYINEVTNDTGVDWTGYLVNVTLNTAAALSSYSISNIAVTASNDSVPVPVAWTIANTPTLIPNGIVGGQYQYIATIDYEGGTPVAGDGSGELDFSYKLTFAGTTSYAAIQEQTPTPNVTEPVPEPSALILAVSGLLGLAVARFARRRS